MARNNPELEKTYNDQYYRWQCRLIAAGDPVAWARRAIGRLQRKEKFEGLTLTHLAEVMKEQKGLCALSGMKLDVTSENPSVFNRASVDRIDNRKGYRNGNVRIVAYCVNALRGGMTDDQMWEVVRQLHRKRPK